MNSLDSSVSKYNKIKSGYNVVIAVRFSKVIPFTYMTKELCVG